EIAGVHQHAFFSFADDAHLNRRSDAVHFEADVFQNRGFIGIGVEAAREDLVFRDGRFAAAVGVAGINRDNVGAVDLERVSDLTRDVVRLFEVVFQNGRAARAAGQFVGVELGAEVVRPALFV